MLISVELEKWNFITSDQLLADLHKLVGVDLQHFRRLAINYVD